MDLQNGSWGPLTLLDSSGMKQEVAREMPWEWHAVVLQKCSSFASPSVLLQDSMTTSWLLQDALLSACPVAPLRAGPR